MVARRKTSKSVVAWDEELAKQAEVAAGLEASSGGGEFFSTAGGVLSWQDAPLSNNEMAVIILGSVFENVYYDKPYDPDVPQAPTCFAFAEEEANLTPDDVVVKAGQAQSTDGCKTCEHNQWGSADRGRGKACRNTRRLAMIPAGTFARDGGFEIFENVDHYMNTPAGFMKLPVTSVKGYANFVKQVAGALKRPPFGIISRVAVVPDPKTQFKVIFEPLQKVPDEFMGTIMERRADITSQINFPYQLDTEDEAPPSRSRAAKKPARRSRKY